MERREKHRIERVETADGEREERNYTSDKDIDIISSLPDCLLIHNLSFLPTRDAFVTSILSRRWGPLWTLIPSNSTNVLPKSVVVNVNQGSAVKTMDFYPLQQTLLIGISSRYCQYFCIFNIC